MATIGNVNVRVTASTIALTKGLGTAAGAVSGFGSKIAGLATRFGPLAAALTGVAGVAGIGLLVKNSFASIDALAKMADAVGLTTESLAGLHRAGERSGVATEAVDKGIARMQKSISTAATTGGALGRNFEQLGLSLDQIRAMSPEDQFLTIADAINRVEDQTDKTRLAMETFGRDGIGILKIVGRGADAARNELAKAAELGLAPSREDAAKVEEANDAIADMKDSFIGVANAIAVTVAPIVTRIANGVTQFGIRTRKAFESVAPIVVQVGNIMATAWNGLSGLASSVFGDMVTTAGGAALDVKDFLLDALIVGEFAFQNLGRISEWAWGTIQLGAIQLFEDFRFLFTGQIPALTKWLAGHWRDVFFSMFDLATTVFINLGKNIRSAMGALWSYIRSGGTQRLKFAWTPLEEGFVNTVRKLPGIPERALTEIEQQLAGRLGQMEEDLTGGLAEHIEMRRNELLGDGEPFQIAETVGIDLPDELADEVGKASGKAPEAFDFGLSQAAKQALQLQARGAGETPEQKTAREVAALKAQQKQQGDTTTSLLREQLAVMRNTPRPLAIV